MIVEPTWTIDEVSNLNYSIASIDNVYANPFIESGHNSSSIIIQNYFEDSPMPESILAVKKYFLWNDCTVAVNFLRPGQYLPHHSDLYARYKFYTKINDVSKIHRAIIMMEDSSPGQFIEINGLMTNHWVAGQTFIWIGSTVHASYNLSVTNRYSIQITGWL